MRMKVAPGGGSLGWLERKEGGKGASDGRRDVLIPREKRRRARARALPETGVAVAACVLAVWSFTYLIIGRGILKNIDII